MKKKSFVIAFALISICLLLSRCSNLPEPEKSIQEYLIVRDKDGKIMTQIDPSIIKLIKSDLIAKNRKSDVQKLEKTYDSSKGVLFKNVEIPLNEGARVASSYGIGIKTTGEAPYATEVYRPYTGQVVGTMGQSKRLESILIFVTDPTTYEAINTGDPRFNSISSAIMYEAHVSGIGWQGPRYTSNGGIQNSYTVAGTIERSERIEAIKISVNPNFATNVAYRAYVAGIGWLPWVSNGQEAGTTGQARRLEAFEFQLLIY